MLRKNFIFIEKVNENKIDIFEHDGEQ